MRALIDTSVVLDFLMAREPFAQAAKELFLRIHFGLLEGCVTAKEITDIHCTASRAFHSKERALQSVRGLLEMVTVLDTTAEDIYRAALGGYPDFEDGVMMATAEREGMDAIITRDAGDYLGAGVRVFSSAEFVGML